MKTIFKDSKNPQKVNETNKRLGDKINRKFNEKLKQRLKEGKIKY